MYPTLSTTLARIWDAEHRRDEGHGYRASADRARRSWTAERRWLAGAAGLTLAATVAVAVSPPIGASIVIAAGVAFVAWIVHGDRRRTAVDRMVELEPFAPPGLRALTGGLVERRRAELSSGAYRKMLAGRVRDAAGAELVVRRFGAPGVHAFAAEPALAERVADALEQDGDERLPLAVHRLLTAGGVDRQSLDRVRSLVA